MSDERAYVGSQIVRIRPALQNVRVAAMRMVDCCSCAVLIRFVKVCTAHSGWLPGAASEPSAIVEIRKIGLFQSARFCQSCRSAASMGQTGNLICY